jgi:hypothetical protein
VRVELTPMPSRMDGSSDALLGTLNVSCGCNRPGRDVLDQGLGARVETQRRHYRY